MRLTQAVGRPADRRAASWARTVQFVKAQLRKLTLRKEGVKPRGRTDNSPVAPGGSIIHRRGSGHAAHLVQSRRQVRRSRRTGWRRGAWHAGIVTAGGRATRSGRVPLRRDAVARRQGTSGRLARPCRALFAFSGACCSLPRISPASPKPWRTSVRSEACTCSSPRSSSPR